MLISINDDEMVFNFSRIYSIRKLNDESRKDYKVVFDLGDEKYTVIHYKTLEERNQVFRSIMSGYDNGLRICNIRGTL